jgi:hypothetical protein
MGIYNNDSMFGLRIYNFNDDDFANILFEEKYDEIIYLDWYPMSLKLFLEKIGV